MTRSNLANLAIVILVIAVLAIAGVYELVQYVKYTPPAFLVELITHSNPPPPLPAGDSAPFKAADGFTATIFSRDVPSARVMVRDPKGTLLVSETKEGKVVALPDSNNDQKADTTIVVLEGLDKPHGIVFQCPVSSTPGTGQNDCGLYVAETGALKQYSYNADTYTAKYVKTITTFPKGDGHFTRTLMFEPTTGELLAAVGSSCNVCKEKDPRRASIMAINVGTGATSTYASGLRNSVFMAVNPIDNSIWATENGRDFLGDDLPPDEINIIERGKNYGWPLCYGNKIHDEDFDHATYVRDPCIDTTASHIDLPSHAAVLGIAFTPNDPPSAPPAGGWRRGWPAGWENDVLVAFHGSWNKGVPSGYEVVRYDLDDMGNVLAGPYPFLSGFLPEGGKGSGDSLGRPVGILAEPGGVAYISDDRAGAIYRIMFAGTSK